MTILFAIFVSLSSSWAYSPWQNFKDGSKQVFSQDTKWIWIGGTVATLAAFSVDQRVRDHFNNDDMNPAYNFIGDAFGTGVPGALIGLFTLGVGLSKDDNAKIEAGTAHLEALAASGLYTWGLKAAVGRDRPHDDLKNRHSSRGSSSFPSGHTSTAFTTAAVVMEFYGPWPGAPVLALASMTGYSRVQRHAHYLSDVLFGATLGYATGIAFSNIHLKHGETKVSWSVLPYFDSRESYGAVATIRF